MRALKQWNDSWDPLVALAPVWADQFMAAGVTISYLLVKWHPT
jgi:hypothetical protein